MVQCSVRTCDKPGTHRGRCNGHKHRHDRYGLTDSEMEALDNGIACEICFVSVATTVDHCHSTGRRRGYLCGLCNSGLGMFKDDEDNLERAISYLQRSRFAPWTRQAA